MQQAQIAETLRTILEPGQVCEVRILDAVTQTYRRPHTVSGYFDDPDALVRAVTRVHAAKGYYFTPNPVNPVLLARSANKLHDIGNSDPTTADTDVTGRRWLLVDADPVRPTGISSSDAEHRAALDKVHEIRDALTIEGWPMPIVADSGNGGHLMYAVDLPTDDGGLVKQVLEALAFRFADHIVALDLTVFNPARIWKLYGTYAGKGDDTSDRPHRLASLLDVPAMIERVPRSLLEALAGSIPTSATPAPKPLQHKAGTQPFDLDSWIATYAADAIGPSPWQGGRKWIFSTCPWDSSHQNRSAYIVQHANGAIAAGCQHNGCNGRDWHALRDTREPGWNNRNHRKRDPAAADVDEASATEPKKVPPTNLPSRNLLDVIAVHKKWLYLPDPGWLEVVLATVVANKKPGDPVWILGVAPPGYGKTETTNGVQSLPDVYPVSTLTEAALLSGVPKKDKAKDAKGGLLREMGEFGILLLKDFGGIMSQNKDTRAAVLAAFREIYDGRWDRNVGADGGRCLHWEGKAGLIGGCTPAIDQAHGVMGALGERFALYRLVEGDEKKQARKALSHAGKEQEMRRELSECILGLFNSLTVSNEPSMLSDAEREWLISLATLTTRCRSAVERNSYKPDLIENIPGAEAPTRFVVMLSLLLDGLRTIGAPKAEQYRLVAKVALDSMPQIRQRAIETLSKKSQAVATSEVALAMSYPTQTARRVLEDLSCYQVVNRTSQGPGLADLWELSADTKKLLTEAGTFPESPNTVSSNTPSFHSVFSLLSVSNITLDGISGKVAWRKAAPKVGDLVNCLSGGVVYNFEPWKIIAIEEGPDGQPQARFAETPDGWALEDCEFVEGKTASEVSSPSASLVFDPSDEWQEVPDGVALPNGLEVAATLGGGRRARLAQRPTKPCLKCGGVDWAWTASLTQWRCTTCYPPEEG